MTRALQHPGAGPAFRALLDRELVDPAWPYSRLVSLIFGILRNVSFETYRESQRVVLVGQHGDEAFDTVDTAANPEEQLLRRERAMQLAGLVQKLSNRQREVLELRVFEGLEYEEIASKLGRSKSTVGVQLRRALLKLAELAKGKGTANG